MIPYGRQDISQDDVNAVLEVLQSDFLTQGPTVPAFEEKIKNYCGVKNAVAVNSSTSALHIACLALGVGPGDIVWTTAITFVASSNCALYCGATVDFVDIDPETYNISISALRLKLEEAAKNNSLPKVIIPVHLTGQPCEMAEIFRLSTRYGFKVIEDASHAIGGKYRGKPVGNCAYSDITIFSFHPVKIITTAEGGVAVTNDNELASKMSLLRSHGITRDQSLMSKEAEGSWYYEQVILGLNYRMTDLQAALGLSQMTRLDEFIRVRHEIAKKYDEAFSKAFLKLPFQLKDCHSSYHLYVLRFDFSKLNLTQKQAFDILLEDGIGVNLHYIPVYLQPYYQGLGFREGYCDEAENYYKEAMSIPIHPNLSVEEQDKVIDSILRIFKV